MDSNIAKAALAFLERCELRGSEAGAYQQVVSAISDAANWQQPKAQLEVVEPTDDLAEK